jgi:hypothetical protein
MNTEQFTKDLRFGKSGEQDIINYFTTIGLNYVGASTYGSLKDYDLKFTNKKGVVKTFEVKTDKYVTPQKDTGNMIVEHSSWGKEAVYTASQADYFVYYFINLEKDNVWIIKMDKLRKLIKDNAGVMSVVNGGDSKATKCIKVPRLEFQSEFTVTTYTKPDPNHTQLVKDLFGPTHEAETGLTIAPAKKGIGKVVFKGKHRDMENPFDGEFITSPLRRLYR